jgi:hypothetical protein
MSTLKITDVQVWNQNGANATLFHPLTDAISLAVSVDISADLTADLNTRYGVYFQLIHALTDEVVVNSAQQYALTEDWPYWWFTAGNNWGPPSDYETAQKWGLILPPPVVFGFRAILVASSLEADGYHAVDALDVSPTRWFQLRGVTGK